MKPVLQAIVLLLAVNAAHAAEKAEPPKTEPSGIQQVPVPPHDDRLDPRVIERAAAQRRTPKVPAFPAEQR